MSAFAFDPDAHLPAPQIGPPTVDGPAFPPTVPKPVQAPREWLHGLELLGDRRKPRLADAARWGQIVRDCWAIVGRSAEIVAAGWSIENLFGFDPGGMSYDYGLAVALRGSPLTAISAEYATIVQPAGTLWHYPNLGVGTPMLWSFDERKL